MGRHGLWEGSDIETQGEGEGVCDGEGWRGLVGEGQGRWALCWMGGLAEGGCAREVCHVA